MKTTRELSFLDLTVINNQTSKYKFKVYRNPAITGLYFVKTNQTSYLRDILKFKN